MQIKRYKVFLKVLSEEPDFVEIFKGFYVYRKTDDGWVDGSDSEVKEDHLVRSFEFTLKKGGHWRRRNGLEAYFPIQQFKAVMVSQSLSPTKTTRDKAQKLLNEVTKRANIEYDATYDGLTGLLNGRSLDEKIREVIGPLPASIPGNNNLANDAEIKPVISVALLALDLDHFKQVNDSYGHEYGDIVLKCFAHRLEEVVNTIQKELVGNVGLEIGRSGGEEFLIIISGDLQLKRVKDIAERIRVSISHHELPTDLEWSSLSNNAMQPPHISDRKITTSVGLSSLKPRTVENLAGAIIEMRREADTALYRAKAGGRNVVRYFPEIRDQFGTVIEHHPETNIVTIDIGSQVNVRAGQEFHVYHPDFTGEKSFVSSDGRSKKRLGTYPRFSSGRIVVFDVQPEISFCTIAEKSHDRFPVGSVLEQIPLGSIYHLVSAEAKASVIGAAQVDELNTYIENIVDNNNRPIAAIFSLRNMPAIEKARGTAFVNRALASLFEAVRQIFPLPAKVCQIESDKIAVAAQIEPKASYGEIIRRIIESAAKKMSNLVEYSSGVFTTKTNQKPIEGDQSIINPKHALSYARYAAVVLATDEKQIIHFSPITANSVIAAHRIKKTLADALVDYEALHGMGIEYSRFENQAALCAFELGNADFALSHVQRAIALEPNFPVLKANLAYIQFMFKQPLQAHEVFVQIHLENPEFELEDVYKSAEALAAYAAYKKNSKTIELTDLKSMLEKALPLAAAGKTNYLDKIRIALKELSSIQIDEGNNVEQQSKRIADLSDLWTKLVESVGKVSSFTRSYLLNAHPISFDNGIFIVGFSEEYKDYLGLVDNARSQTLIINKLRELGRDVSSVKFIKD